MRRKLAVVLLSTVICLLGATFALTQELPGLYNLDEYEEITGRKIEKFNEAPILRTKVAAGELPPVEERLPENPLVIEPWEEIGKYGGTARHVMHDANYDLFYRHMLKTPLLSLGPSSSYMHYSLVGGPVRPGVFEKWEMSEDGRVFSFQIRKGLKWSDGVPVTTEDVRYNYKNCLRGEEYAKEFMTPTWATWGGEIFELEIVDDHTFRMKFAKPFGSFITQIVRAGRWHLLMRPKHYLKQFDIAYTPMEKILPAMKKHGYVEDEYGKFFKIMVGDFTDKGGGLIITLPDVVDYPVLDPWVAVSNPKPGEFIFERNPYFYMIDPAGNQLPYIDKLHREHVTDVEMMTLKVVAGETDFQTKYLRLKDYPLFMKNRERGGYEVMLLKTADVQQLQFIFNLTPNDPVMRQIVQDVRFRRAMSLAVNREEIIETIFLGFGRPAQVTSAKGTAFWEEEFEKAYIEYDPERANELLDEMGLKWDKNHQYRLRPDGEKLVFPLIYYDVMSGATPGAEALSRYLTKIGINAPIKHVSSSYFWSMWGNKETWLSVWMRGGDILAPWWETGLSVPASDWWLWYQSGGERGTEPLPAAKRMYELRDIVQMTTNEEERIRAGKEMYRIAAENIWEIGTAAGTPLPFIYSKKLGNIGVAKEMDFLLTNVLATEAAVQWFFKE